MIKTLTPALKRMFLQNCNMLFRLKVLFLNIFRDIINWPICLLDDSQSGTKMYSKWQPFLFFLSLFIMRGIQKRERAVHLLYIFVPDCESSAKIQFKNNVTKQFWLSFYWIFNYTLIFFWKEITVYKLHYYAAHCLYWKK